MISHRLRSSSTAIGLVVLTLLGLNTAVAAGAAKASPWLGLAKGKLGDYQWSVKVKRPDGPAGAGADGALRPCLLVRTKWQVGSYSYHRSQYRACANSSSHLKATDPPLIGSGAQPTSEGASGLTAIGIIVPPAVHHVRVTLSNGTKMTLPLHQLTPKQARAAELGRLRYSAFAVRGEWCAERIVTLNAAGTPLWDSGADEYSCAPGELRRVG